MHSAARVSVKFTFTTQKIHNLTVLESIYFSLYIILCFYVLSLLFTCVILVFSIQGSLAAEEYHSQWPHRNITAVHMTVKNEKKK